MSESKAKQIGGLAFLGGGGWEVGWEEETGEGRRRKEMDL